MHFWPPRISSTKPISQMSIQKMLIHILYLSFQPLSASLGPLISPNAIIVSLFPQPLIFNCQTAAGWPWGSVVCITFDQQVNNWCISYSYSYCKFLICDLRAIITIKAIIVEVLASGLCDQMWSNVIQGWAKENRAQTFRNWLIGCVQRSAKVFFLGCVTRLLAQGASQAT